MKRSLTPALSEGEGVSIHRIDNGNKVKTTFWNRKNNIWLSSPSPFGELSEAFSRPKGVTFRVRLKTQL